jgi:hypothetical protein
MVNPLGLLSAPQRCCLAAVLALTVTPATADPLSDRQQLAGDYFVGASVFLFERTVLAAFAPPDALEGDSTEATLDAGAIVLARENAGEESGSVALQAILGWLNAWLSPDKKHAIEGPPGFGAERRASLACLAYGADPDVSVELAAHASLGADDRGACIARYAEARKKWTGWLQSFRKAGDGTVRAEPEGAPAEEELVLRLTFAPTMDEADQAIADAMRENGLFQVLTDDLNASLAMPRPITALITQCGEPKAFYNPDRGEAVLCYEMLGALLKTAP